MTPELTADSPGEAPRQPPSTAGMTTKVVKGSMWTLAGSVAPLSVSLVTTPFVIRMLGAEGYGVFVLVGLIPTYFAFADFGMSIASTKFASEAYAEGDQGKEAVFVQTAALIALGSSLPIAAALIAFSPTIVGLFNAPVNLMGEATLALRLVSIAFVVNILCSVLNSPQLARMRMDLNTLVNSVSRITALIAAPITIYLGYGLVGAVGAGLAGSLLNLGGHAMLSRQLLNTLFVVNIRRSAVPELLRMGSRLVLAGVAAGLLLNSEKLILARIVSVESLAYYSVAFTFATLASTLTAPMIQSLVPAFSQLLATGDSDRLHSLFSRTVRLNLALLLPFLLLLFLGGRTLILLWAGAEYANHSAAPFYILLVGLFFNIMAFVPYSALLASGRAGLFAKLYWFELLPYLATVALLTSALGILGAAVAWCLRVVGDAILLGYMARREDLARVHITRSSAWFLSFVGVGFVVVILSTLSFDLGLLVSVILALTMLAAYGYFGWKVFLQEDEKLWFYRRMSSAFSRN